MVYITRKMNKIYTLLIILVILLGILAYVICYYFNIYMRTQQIEKLSMPDLNLGAMGIGYGNDDDDNLTDEESMLKDYMGENYSYIKNVKTPKQLGVNSSSNIFQIPKNIDAIKKYTNYLAKEPKLGSNYFVKSGYCGSESVPECKGEQRWIFIRNIPTGTVPCTNIKTSMKGLVPGMLEDINDINPYETVMNTMGKGVAVSSKCVLRTENIGTINNSKKQTKCAAPSRSVSCMPEY